jgi:hypothetical protein
MSAAGGGASSQPVMVIKESVTSVSLLILSHTNYHEWVLMMKVNLEAMGLWSAVQSSNVEHREDLLALAIMLHAVPLEMHSGLATKESTTEAWEAVKKM